jgi:hypothetical protein
LTNRFSSIKRLSPFYPVNVANWEVKTSIFLNGKKVDTLVASKELVVASEGSHGSSQSVRSKLDRCCCLR